MAKVHHFQRYSSLENTVTNNTLQLFARIYAYAPQRAAEFINRLVDADVPIEIGLEIKQQERADDSVPDGEIIQRSFKILIETKVHATPTLRQLCRHAKGFDTEAVKVLLLLTKSPLAENEAVFTEELGAHYPDVVFKAVTFDGVLRALEGLFQEYEYQMVELVEDYVEYCWDSGLVDRSQYLLRIVPCGKSLNINLRHGIYFHPSDRGYTPHKFTGVYKDKRVHAIWENDYVVNVTYANGELTKVPAFGSRETDEYDAKIIQIIDDAREECGYEIAKGHRFFCGQKFRTDFAKASRGGIMGSRYFDTAEVVGEFEDVEDLALKLKGRVWE